MVEFCAIALQLIIHIECNDHAVADVDKFGCDVEVVLQVRCAHYIQNDVWGVLCEIFANIALLVCSAREGICAREVGDVKFVAFVVTNGCLSLYCCSAVVGSMLVLTRYMVV